MLTIDIIVLVVGALCIVGGILGGFGKVLNFFTKGIFGKIISIFVCYFLFGVVLDWPFVKEALTNLNQSLASSENFICDLLIKIRLDLIVFAVALFFAVQLLRKLAVKLIDKAFSANNPVMKVINKVLGVALAFFCVAVILLTVFQILAWTTGINGSVYQAMQGSFFKLDKLFVSNPLNAIFESIKQRF
ncbi:MAG: hypothetical protein IJA88_03670 [Clostridia bacterium]|nr:hypothetical protein [Clostridia bacterium]